MNSYKWSKGDVLEEVSDKWEGMTNKRQDLFCKLVNEEEKSVVAVNVGVFVENMLSKNRDTITSGMKDNELKAFDYGIKNCISLINSLFAEDDEIVICKDYGVEMEDVLLEDIL